jgi:hypothetical protein
VILTYSAAPLPPLAHHNRYHVQKNRPLGAACPWLPTRRLASTPTIRARAAAIPWGLNETGRMRAAQTKILSTSSRLISARCSRRGPPSGDPTAIQCNILREQEILVSIDCPRACDSDIHRNAAFRIGYGKGVQRELGLVSLRCGQHLMQSGTCPYTTIFAHSKQESRTPRTLRRCRMSRRATK